MGGERLVSPSIFFIRKNNYMANISSIRLSGTTYNIKDNSATTVVEITQAEYNALVTKDPNVLYVISDAAPAEVIITTTITSSSTNGQVPSAKAVYDFVGGLKMVKITSADYQALATKDENTVYFVGDATNGYTMKLGEANIN